MNATQTTAPDAWHLCIETPIIIPRVVKLLPPDSGEPVSLDDAVVPDAVREQVTKFIETASRRTDKAMRDGVTDETERGYAVIFNLGNIRA